MFSKISMIKKTMTITSMVIAMLGLSLMVSGIPLSFAAESTLDAKCDTESEKRLSADCELLQKLNDLEAELKAKDAELMAKDMELMDKDMELMDKDMELMDKDDLLEANIDITCDAIPVIKSAFASVTSATTTAFGTVNTGIGLINNSVIGPLKTFNLNSISVDPPNLNLGNILPDGIHVGTFTALGFTFVDPTDIFLTFTDLNVDIPPVSAPSSTPFAGMPTIPLVSTAPIDAADDAIQSLLVCV